MLINCGVRGSSVHCTPRSLGSQVRTSRGIHMPEKSGLPPEVLGAGAARSTLLPGVGKLIHWAVAGRVKNAASVSRRIVVRADRKVGGRAEALAPLRLLFVLAM